LETSFVILLFESIKIADKIYAGVAFSLGDSFAIVLPATQQVATDHLLDTTVRWQHITCTDSLENLQQLYAVANVINLLHTA